VNAAMRGIIPATVGLSLAMGVQMAVPLTVQGHREGPPRLAVHMAVLVGAAAVMMAGVSPLVVLVLAGAVTVLLLAFIPARNAPVRPPRAAGQPDEGRP
jgi:hypothetical protein